MKRFLALLIAVPACFGGEREMTGQCPTGETCSPKTPSGLEFEGADLAGTLFASGPSPTAIGGTQKITLKYAPTGSDWQLLDLPFKAETSGALGVSVTATTGAIVTVTGTASGVNYLRIVDPGDNTLFDRKQMGAGSVDTIELIPATLERVPADADLAWAPGTFDIGVALYGKVATMDHQRLVDESTTLDLAGAQQKAWDTLSLTNAQPGTSTLMVTAGDKPAAAIDIVVTATADQVQPDEAPTAVSVNGPTEVCFIALSGSRTIVGLPWTFTVDGAPGQADLSPNCTGVKTTKTTGTVTITGAAGGKNATLVLPVSTMARTQTRVAPQLPTTAGDRAAM